MRRAGLRILYLCGDPGIPVLGFKGASTHVRAMVEALATQGHEVTVVCAARGEGNVLGADLVEVAPNDEARRLGRLADQAYARSGLVGKPGSELKRLHHNGALVEALHEVCRALDPHLLYERYALLCNAGARIAHARGLPHVLEVNAPLIAERHRYWGLETPEAARTIEREVFAGAGAVLAVSKPVRDYVIAGGAVPERVTVLPNAVDPALFRPDGPAAEAVRAAHGLRGATVIGFAGSLRPWHGVELLLDALARLGDRQLRLLIVGDGPEGEALRQRARRPDLAGTVVFAGHVPHAQMGAYLSAMDIGVAPYCAPGADLGDFYFSPLKIFEYLAAGLPVVAPALGQIAEVVEDGRNGLLYPAGDVTELAGRLDVLSRNPALRAEMGRAGMALVGERHTWAANAARVVEIAWRLLAHPLARASGAAL
jgi:glycosyltransferase involved in cell wall biosynthesis